MSQYDYVVVVPGRPPIWVANHTRHLACRLAEIGQVIVATSYGPDFDRILPGEVGEGTTLGNAVNGYPIWTGGLSATLGLMHRSEVMVIVLWSRSLPTLAVIAGVVGRLRGEHVVLDIETTSESKPGWWSRSATWMSVRLARATIVGSPAASSGQRKVVALCGADTDLARCVLNAFSALSDQVADEWQLSLCVDDRIDASAIQRHADRVSVASSMSDVSVIGASVVLVPHGHFRSDLLELAIANGSAGVLVGHPVAERIAKRADGVWLASRDPSSILVALESTTGAISDDAVSMLRLQDSIDQVLEVVTSCRVPGATTSCG